MEASGLRSMAMVALCAVLLGMPWGSARALTVDEAIAANLGDPAGYRDVIAALQSAVRAHDAVRVAALIRYPIGVTLDGRHVTIAGPQAFIANYAQIVTPAIAAAVDDAHYDDLMINYQGVMLGRGEVWINGICADTACKTVNVKVVTIQSTEQPASVATAVAAAIPQSKMFKDWVVGCDNLRSCTVLGLPVENEMGAYLKLTRGGGGLDAPAVEFTMALPDGLRAPSLRVVLDGRAVTPTPLPGRIAGDFVAAALDESQIPAFIAAVRNAKSMTLDVVEGPESKASQPISVAGSAAALLFVDDMQKRVGTLTALAGKGDAPAATIPPVPELPVIRAQPVQELPEPVPPLPPGIVNAPDPSCKTMEIDNLAMRLSPALTLWGVCTMAGAYNLEYRLFMVGDGPIKAAKFVSPFQTPADDPSTLVSPGLSDDGTIINAFTKYRGIGDCGEDADWAWNGTGFELLRFAKLEPCRGVPADDWPVLFRARRG